MRRVRLRNAGARFVSGVCLIRHYFSAQSPLTYLLTFFRVERVNERASERVSECWSMFERVRGEEGRGLPIDLEGGGGSRGSRGLGGARECLGASRGSRGS